jgi:hypothetical protein
MDSINDYLDLASDEEIARFAALFTDRVSIAVLRRLTYGKCAVTELSQHCKADKAALEKALDHLEACRMVTRNSDGRVEPIKDAVTYLLTFLGMSALYRGQVGVPKVGDDTSRDIINQVARDLACDIAHQPPLDTFRHLFKADRTITLFQAIPLSLSPEKLARIKTGEKLPVGELNPSQQDYLRAMMETLGSQPKDFASIVLSIDPTHEKGDDHAHIVIEADSGLYSHHIDAFLDGTSLPGWY